MLPPYAELHCLSNFSFLRGASHPEELVERAHAQGYAALALTDECSLAGIVRAHLAAKDAALPLVVGSEFTLVDGVKLVLYATDRATYGDLCQLITRGRRQALKGRYALTRADVAALAPRCLALWVPGDAAPEPARWIADVFSGRAWIAVQRFARSGDRSRLEALHALARATGLPLVAAGDVHMHVRARRALQDTLTAIRLRTPLAECGYALFANGERHLRSRARLSALYPRELTDATLDVVARCAFSLDELRYEYPEELVPAGATPASHLRSLVEAGLVRRYGSTAPPLVPCNAPPLQGAPSPASEGRSSRPEHARGNPALAPASGEREEILATARDARVPPSNVATMAWNTSAAASPSSDAAISPPSPRLRGEGWGEGPREDADERHAEDANEGRSENSSAAYPPNAEVPPDVRDLIEHELALIAELGYEPYFLTVHDIVDFARRSGILCQGRGSAANSAVCYALGITEVDPARMSMLFERFISRERNEPPDIDVDFEHQRREEVMQYVYGKYGRDRAALAATLITYRPKSAVRDVGRALGLDLAQVDRLSGMFAWWDGRRIDPERIREAGFAPDNPLIERLVMLTGDLMGFPRHLSQHVGGFVIARGLLERMVPVENAAMADRTVIQWDKDDLDAMGLLKVDCLALGMLSAIRRALDMISRFRGIALRMQDIPAEDPAVYAMCQRADTVGVFQIESRAQQSMLPRLRPACFYDLVIEVAIVRPGPIQGGMVHPYLKRRQGLEPVTYPSAAVKSVLERTLGVPIFQEQVMQLAIVAAGFSPGEADQLRRSMAAWRRKGGLEKFEQRLIDGMGARGLSEAFARQIYQQILGFGEYGFPESHSASFSLLVYVSAWLKLHEPAAFCAALLNSLPMGFYAPAQLVADARRHDVVVRNVDVTISEWDCTLEASSPLQGASFPAGNDRSVGAEHARRNPDLAPSPLPCGKREQVVPAVASASLASASPEIAPSPGRGEGWGEGRVVEKLGSESNFPGTEGQRHATGSANSTPTPISLRGEGEGWSEGRGEGQRHTPTLRLGLRMVAGLKEDSVARIVAARAVQPFAHVADLAHRARLDRRDLTALAAAGALAALAGHRHAAVWEVAGVEKLPPILAGAGATFAESAPALAAPAEGQDIAADYRSLGLTLGRHPLALLRGQLAARRLVTSAEVSAAPHGRIARIAGLVIGRQRPDTASGVVFVTLEDETGATNVIVWRDLSDRQRRELLGARLMAVFGRVEREGDVVHLIAGRLADLTPMLGSLPTRSRDFH